MTITAINNVINDVINLDIPLIFKDNIDIKQYLNGKTPPWLQDIINIPTNILQEKEILNLSSSLGTTGALIGEKIGGTNSEGFLFKSNQ